MINVKTAEDIRYYSTWRQKFVKLWYIIIIIIIICVCVRAEDLSASQEGLCSMELIN
jgi:hypothetical protein